jgi:hypothetical protein
MLKQLTAGLVAADTWILARLFEPILWQLNGRLGDDRFQIARNMLIFAGLLFALQSAMLESILSAHPHLLERAVVGFLPYAGFVAATYYWKWQQNSPIARLSLGLCRWGLLVAYASLIVYEVIDFYRIAVRQMYPFMLLNGLILIVQVLTIVSMFFMACRPPDWLQEKRLS